MKVQVEQDAVDMKLENGVGKQWVAYLFLIEYSSNIAANPQPTIWEMTMRKSIRALMNSSKHGKRHRIKLPRLDRGLRFQRRNT